LQPFGLAVSVNGLIFIRGDDMRVLLFLAFLMMPFYSFGQSSVPGFILRDAGSIEAAADRLEAELGDKAMVFEIIGNHPGHSMYLVLRGKSGTSEIHLTESDYYIGVRGNATFVIGGELVDGQELERKQVRGTDIKGGERSIVGPGDIVHVPVNTPHHLIINPVEPYMYLLIKLDEEPLN
jgi:mannose-6-phosphate isomerase-like protein (cupin superfamily)